MQVNAILDPMVTNAGELISDVKTGGSLGHNDHTLVEFAALGDMGQARSRNRTPNLIPAPY